eukprot:2129272-Prymnesium_polylepis.1
MSCAIGVLVVAKKSFSFFRMRNADTEHSVEPRSAVHTVISFSYFVVVEVGCCASSAKYYTQYGIAGSLGAPATGVRGHLYQVSGERSAGDTSTPWLCRVSWACGRAGPGAQMCEHVTCAVGFWSSAELMRHGGRGPAV